MFHILIGISSYLTKWVLIGWMYLFIIFSLWELIRTRRSLAVIVGLCLSYIMGIELLCRIVASSPYIPYEFGKYYFFLIILIYFIRSFELQMSPGLFICLVCLPALFFIPGKLYFVYFVNSFSGIFVTGLLGHLFYKKKIYVSQVKTILLLILYGVVAITISVILQSPDIDDIDFTLAANAQTTGNFGSNQVSTILGLDVMAIGMSLLLYLNLFNSQLISLFFLILFSVRGLLTFSRGGIMGGVLALVVIYFLPLTKGVRRRKIGFPLFLLVILVLGGVFFYVNQLTGDALLNRFKGETEGTQRGIREVTLETITSRRSTLMVTEWEIFRENPLVGVGPGGGYEAREEKLGIHIASHTEVTRLVAEHGILGIVVALIFLFYPAFKIYFAANSFDRLISTAFFIFAIFTSMHAAMRTSITPFLWGISCATFIGHDPLIRKKTRHKL